MKKLESRMSFFYPCLKIVLIFFVSNTMEQNELLFSLSDDDDSKLS